ncbi:MAG: (deoxy)nucleoside triphosphate pyrophosphohydrolase [Candidatus Acidiferrales bacterium]
MVTVVAALIEENGRILICQRSRSGSFPLSWEFPGGKVEPGETLVQALAREIHEELGVACTVGAEQYRTRHRYAQQPELADGLELIFFSVQISGPPQNLAFAQIIWERIEALGDYDFLPADRELVAQLVARSAGPRFW